MAIHAGYHEGSFDCLLHGLMHRKRLLADSALWPMGDTQAGVGELTRLLDSAAKREGADPVRSAIAAMYARDGLEAPVWEQDGSIRVS